MKSGRKSYPMSSGQILQTLQPQGGLNPSLAQQQEEIDERDRMISEIETSINEVNGLMVTLAGLIEEQHHTLDTLENHLENAATQTQQGVSELKQAAEYQENRRCVVS